jgi:hypothetical protein
MDAASAAMKDDPATAGRRRRNVRTGLILLSIAAAFFLGVIAKYLIYG